MSAAWIDLLHGLARCWAGGMARASWQGGAVIALAWAVCRALPALPPRVRCWLWRLAYIKLLLALVWATPIDLPLRTGTAGESRQASGVRRQAPGGSAASRLRLPAPVPERQFQAGKDPAALAATGDWRLAPGLLLLWLLGCGWCAARVVRDCRRARRLGRECRPAGEEWLARECRDLCRQLGVRGVPRLLLTEGIGSPLLLGAPEPALVLPAALLDRCAPGELRLMLAHELAHLRRQDLRWGWLPAAAHALFYFHPLVWLANREWRLSQELAADELAVLATRAPVDEYGEMLVNVAAQLRKRPPFGLATLGVLDSPRTLRQRLRAMAQIRRHSRRQRLTIGGVTAAAGLALLVPWRVTARAATGRTAVHHARLEAVNALPHDAAQPPTGAAPAESRSSSSPIYFHTAFFANGPGQIARRSDLLNVPLDVDLRQVPLREALRRLCATTQQGFVIDANVPADQRVTVRGQGVQLFRVLDEVIRQVGGGWMQEMRNGKPTIRVGRDLFLTMHTGPLKLPRDRGFLKQIGAVAHLSAGGAGSAAR